VQFILGIVSDRYGCTLMLSSEYEWVLWLVVGMDGIILLVVRGGNG
jgi:hypothetical protein